jgi:KTSC domain
MASSNVEAIRYLWDVQTLEVEFKGADKQGEAYDYQYFGVPPSVANDFTLSASPGRFVWSHLRDRYPYVRLHGFAATAPRTPSVIRTPSEAELTRKGINPAAVPWALTPPWKQGPWQTGGAGGRASGS